MSFNSFLAVRWAERRLATRRRARRLRPGARGRRQTFGCPAPFIGLPPTEAARPHDDVLCSGDPDHLLKPRRPTGAWDLAKPLLRQRIEAGLRDHAEIAGEHQFESDPKCSSKPAQRVDLFVALTAGRLAMIPRKPMRRIFGLLFERSVMNSPGFCLRRIVRAVNRHTFEISAKGRINERCRFYFHSCPLPFANHQQGGMQDSRVSKRS